MRSAFLVLLLTAPVALAQPQESTPVRYGVRVESVLYPQATSRQAMATAVALIERKKFDYLTAYLIDSATIDARVAQRATMFLPAIERQLDEVRAQQRLKPGGIPPENRIPDDARKFADMARAQAEALAFKEIVKDVRAHLSEYPEHLALFRKCAADGDFADGASESVATLKTDFEKKVFLKKEGTHWVIEDRKTEIEKKK